MFFEAPRFVVTVISASFLPAATKPRTRSPLPILMRMVPRPVPPPPPPPPPRPPPAVAGARLEEALKAEAEGVSVGRDRQSMDLGSEVRSLFIHGDVSNDAGVQAEGGHDPLAVPELEERLDGDPVPGGRGKVDDPRGIGGAEVREEDRGRAGRAGEAGQDRVPLAKPRFARGPDLALPLHPAVGRDQNGGV